MVESKQTWVSEPAFESRHSPLHIDTHCSADESAFTGKGFDMNPRRRLRYALIALVLAAFAHSPLLSADLKNEAMATRMKRDLTFISSDECEGRGVTTRGINLAAD